MNTKFQPDYRYIEQAARNIKAGRVPLYEHGVHPKIMAAYLGEDPYLLLMSESGSDRLEGARRICDFFVRLGYDVATFDFCATEVVQQGAALSGHAAPLITVMDDLESWDWEGAVHHYIELCDKRFQALCEALPPGMKGIGGVGNGVFEVVQDFVPLIELAYLQVDEPEVYEQLWQRVGNMLFKLWQWFLPRYGDSFAVCRMGDDLGFRSSTLIHPEQIRKYILPQYKRIVDLVHAHGKPFLLHSCGCIFNVMDEIIDEAGIDAKHSNEDAISTFEKWLEKYNGRIGLFGGIDMDLLCREDERAVRNRTRELLQLCECFNGVAIGCGNSIADYVPLTNYLAMIETVREYRGDYK